MSLNLVRRSTKGTRLTAADHDGNLDKIEQAIEGIELTPGEDGREVQLQATATHIQWRYAGEATWINLVALTSITGPGGDDGADGREVQMQANATHIQWRYAGQTDWQNLVALAAITGADGEDGQDGTDGREVQLQVSATHVQWRYAGAASWTDLIALSALQGSPGSDGLDGEPGPAIELQATATHIQWRVVGAASWINLVALASLKGDPGDPAPGTDLGYDAATRVLSSSSGNDATLPLVTSSNAGLQPATGYGTITYAAQVTLDAAALAGQMNTISLTGNLELLTSNLANDREVRLRLVCDSSQRTLTFPTGWKFVGTKPANIAASKVAILSLAAFGTTNADVVAAYAVQS